MTTLNPTPAAESTSAPQPTGLVQTLGLFSSTAIVVGSMIGSGIFLVDADIARGTNSPALFLAAWVVTAIMTMIGALSYGELAAMMPKAGGQYVYLRESLGPLWGFLYGWTLFWSSRPAPSPRSAWRLANFSASFSRLFQRLTGFGTLPTCRRFQSGPWSWATWRSVSTRQT